MKKSKQVKLYNVFFPIWMLILMPVVWWAVIPVNFIIDSAVLIGGMYWLKITEKKQFYKKNILKVFGFGMLADIIGSLCLLGVLYLFAWLDAEIIGDEWFFTAPAVILSAVLIFVFNYFITFRKEEMPFRKKLSLLIAIITAPYTFLIPISWLYGF